MDHLPHGGDWASFVAEYGAVPLDFSASVSPLGTPRGVQAAIATAAQTADRYPDPLCRTLRQAIAGTEGVGPDQVLCGNGAAELIYRGVLALQPRRALVLSPTFSEYEAALDTVGCDTLHYPLREAHDFVLQEDILQYLTQGIGMVFLCEPNNPTGRTTPQKLLWKIAQRCQEVGAVLVVDECFNSFLDQPKAHSMVDVLGECPNLLLLKAFTKFYGMAGVRLGYALAQAPLLKKVEKAGPPWSVSGLAQAAGVAALREVAYVKTLRTLIQEQRPLLRQGLEALGLTVVPGEANYLLFRAPKPLSAHLRQRGIMLRDCGNYHNLEGNWYRVAVRTGLDNQVLLRALEEVLS